MDPTTAIEIEKIKINHENEKRNTEKDISKINETIREGFVEIKKNNEEIRSKIEKLSERPTVSPTDLKDGMNEFHLQQSEDRKRIALLESRNDKIDGSISTIKWLLGAATSIIVLLQFIIGAAIAART